jgi:hypothetical protein
MALAFHVNFQNTDAHASNSRNAVAIALKKRYSLGNYGENSMTCVQVDFVQALLPEFPKKINSCILYRQNQNKCCTEIRATCSVLFLICTVAGHNQRPLVPKKIPIKRWYPFLVIISYR